MWLVTYECVCDLCGASVDVEKQDISADTRWQWAVPRMYYAFEVKVDRMSLNLCRDCYTPIIDAVRVCIEKLKK